MTRTVIVGAGPAGLAGAFWRLRADPTADVVVLEGAGRPGGWVRSERHAGFLCELGPQAIRPGAELDELLAALGAADRLVPASAAATARWIGRGGRLLPVPRGPGQLLRSPLLTLGGKLRLLREPFVRAGDPGGESVTGFVGRRFGAQTAPLVQAMVNGIFAGDADRLELESAFPILATAERLGGGVLRGMKAARRQSGPPRRRGGPPLYSLRSGMAELIDLLAGAIGHRLQTGTPAVGVRRIGPEYEVHVGDGPPLLADELVLACPARVSARLLQELDPELAAELAAIPFAAVASVYLGFPAADLPPTMRGFGFLLERGEDSPVLGAIYCADLFPDHAPAGHGLIRVMLGGTLRPAAVELPDAELIAAAEAAVRRYGGLQVPCSFRHVARTRAAIPQYDLGHARRMARIEHRLQRLPGLSLRGNSYRAVALAGQLGPRSGTDAVPVAGPHQPAEPQVART